MNPIEDIIKLLEQEGLAPVLETIDHDGRQSQNIKWKNHSGSECVVLSGDTAVDGEKIAWFESDYWSYHRLKIMENGEIFSWQPETYNPVFGCYCLLLEWYKGHLLFIYQEKHDIYICTIINKKINFFHFHGEEIERKGNLISFNTYSKTGEPEDHVKIIKIPELELQQPITRTEAERMGLIPTGLNRFGGL